MFWKRKNEQVKEEYEDMFSVLTTEKTKITGISGCATIGKERDARISITFDNKYTLRFRVRDVELEPFNEEDW